MDKEKTLSDIIITSKRGIYYKTMDGAFSMFKTVVTATADQILIDKMKKLVEETHYKMLDYYGDGTGAEEGLVFMKHRMEMFTYWANNQNDKELAVKMIDEFGFDNKKIDEFIAMCEKNGLDVIEALSKIDQELFFETFKK